MGMEIDFETIMAKKKVHSNGNATLKEFTLKRKMEFYGFTETTYSQSNKRYLETKEPPKC